jgi:hypothetical protein
MIRFTFMAARAAALCGALAVTSSWADSVMSRAPSDSSPASIETRTFDGGTDSLNPDATPVLVDGNFWSTTTIRVDADRGVIKGLAGFSLANNVATTPADGVTALALGVAQGNGVLNTLGVSTDPVRIEFAFNGRFTGISGDPFMSFVGGLTVVQGDLLQPGRQTIYQSELGFFRGQGQGLHTQTTASRLTIVGDMQTLDDPFAGALPLVVESSADGLSGVVSVSFVPEPGAFILVAATLSGTTGAELDALGTTRLASGGTVEFQNSGTLRILLPQGYSFADPDSLLANVATVVPEPASIWMLSMGIAALAAQRKLLAAFRSRRTPLAR